MKPLLVLDLNGTILHRLTTPIGRQLARSHPSYAAPDFIINAKPCHMRPHFDSFARHIFRHFKVAVWTSAMPNNAVPMAVSAFNGYCSLDAFKSDVARKRTCVFPEESLLFVWTQLDCYTLPPERSSSSTGYIKPVFVKDLSKIWTKYPAYTPSNTLVLDDSTEKLPPSQHGCLIHIREFRIDDPSVDHALDSELKTVQAVLDERLARMSAAGDALGDASAAAREPVAEAESPCPPADVEGDALAEELSRLSV